MKMKDVVTAMRRQEGWHAVGSGNEIILARQFSGRQITLILKHSDGKYFLQHPSYEYVNKIAHFRSVEREIRLSLNKTYLSSIIKALRRAGVWHFIKNQNFLKVNNLNSNSDKGKVRRELKALLT